MTDLFEVEVIESHHDGVLVRFQGDERLGFIRRREISWDRSIRSVIKFPVIGEKINIVLTSGIPKSSILDVSLRQCTTPWEISGKEFSLNQIVEGEVVSVRDFAVFIQLLPGIDAIIWSRDIPLKNNDGPSSLLAVGDQVQGIITRIELDNHKIEVSLVHHIFEFHKSPPQNSDIQSRISRELGKLSSENILNPDYEVNNRPEAQLWRGPILLELTRALVIDNEKAELRKICGYLRSVFGFTVDCAQSGQEGIDLIQDKDYQLVIIDLRLTNEKGTDIAKSLLALNENLAIIFVSSDSLAESEITPIFGRKYPFVYKDPEAIANLIDNLRQGYVDSVMRNQEINRNQDNFIEQLGMSVFTNRETSEILQELLHNLRMETHVSQVLVVEADPIDQSVLILAGDPPIDNDIQSELIDGLYFSRVREIVENNISIYENDISEKRPERLRNFFSLLEYYTYYGIPLNIPEFGIRHALFAFDNDRFFLEEQDLRQIRLAGNFVKISLERGFLLGYMQRYAKRYSLGLLLGSLVHEFRTKLDGLSGFSLSLSKNLERASSFSGSDRLESIASSNSLANQIGQTKDELIELVDAYSLLAKGEFEPFDVKTGIEKTKTLLLKRAGEAGIVIRLDIEDGIPLALGNLSRFEQIVSNLILNSIQQIEKQNQLFLDYSRQNLKGSPIRKSGLVIVQARHNLNGNLFPIQICIYDTGPGIHYHDYERIFKLDVSTRKVGQGLGLFISRNLVETMHGRLRLISSIIFIGSVFLLELSQAKVEGRIPK